MFWLTSSLFIVILILLIRLYLISKGVQNITHQLKEYNTLSINKKINISLSVKMLEDLAESVNECISMSNRFQNEQKQVENEFRAQVANISHDLRTPLTSIMGYVQIMKRGKIEEANWTLYLNRIETRAKNLYELIESFFTLSLIDSPDYTLELTTIDLKKLLIEVMLSWYDQLNDKGIELQFEYEDIPYIVEGEELAIKRVLSNLISNLMKHSAGKATIKLEEKATIKLSIINSANGLTAENKEKIFERFYTGYESRTSNSGNTGLGLTIVKSLMLKMNGIAGCEIKDDTIVIYCEWQRASVDLQK